MAAGTSRRAVIGLWVFKALIALLFLFTGSLKLIGMPMLVHEFDIIGLGQGFRLFTGAVEVGGAILLLIPRTFRFGAPLLLAVSLGACVTQAARLHGDVIHTLVLILATDLLTWIAWRPKSAAA